VFAKPGERTAIETVARDHGVPFAGLWLTAPVDVLEARVATRTGDASDADVAVVRKQAAYDPGVIDWLTLDASGKLDEVLREGLAKLSLPMPEG